MGQISDKIQEVLQSVSELEHRMEGAPSVQTQIDSQKAELTTYAQSLQVQTNNLDQQRRDFDAYKQQTETTLADREAKVTDRENKVELAKASLKAQVSSDVPAIPADATPPANMEQPQPNQAG